MQQRFAEPGMMAQWLSPSLASVSGSHMGTNYGPS